MSYKLNQQDPTRRLHILARRDKRNLPYGHTIILEDDGSKTFIPAKGAPAFGKNPGLLTKKTKRCMIKRAIRRKLPDAIVEEIMLGTATRTMVYGYHPTKRRAA